MLWSTHTKGARASRVSLLFVRSRLVVEPSGRSASVAPRRVRAIGAGALAVILSAFAVAEQDTVDEGRALAILERAFAYRYALSLTADVELEIGSRGGSSRRRVLRMATLHDGDAYRALGQLLSPEYLRGMTILSLSAGRADHQAFVYLPSQDRVRRIAITHKDDAFLGSDLTYEDFERRYADDCIVRSLENGEVAGERVHIIGCTPRAKLQYDRAEFVVAASDFVILESREYRAGRPAPSRLMTAERKGVEEVGGHSLPTRLRFESPERGTVTAVTFSNLEARRIDPRLFTVAALARQPDLGRAKDGVVDVE